MSAEVVENKGGEFFSFNWLEDVECVSLTVTYGFVNGKGITPYFGIVSEWGSADLAADMEYIKDGQASSVFSWGKKEVEGQMLVLAAQPYFISLEQSIAVHIAHIPCLLSSWLHLGLASTCCLSITIDQGPATSFLLQPYQEKCCGSNSAKLCSSLLLLLQNWIICTTLWPSSDLYIHS